MVQCNKNDELRILSRVSHIDREEDSPVLKMVLRNLPDMERTEQVDLPVINVGIGQDDFTVVIPVLNEEKGIERVLEEVRREGYGNILIVDGYSSDKTTLIASMNGAKVIYQSGLGKCGAIKTAIDHIKTPYFVVMDGDCTYDPRDIQNFIPHMKANDEVIGFRSSGRNNISMMNRFGNWMISSFFNVLFRTNLKDICSGMYTLRTDFARMLDLKSSAFEVEVEIAAQAASEGRVTQVPIHYYSRLGQQKLHPWKHGLQILFTVLNMARYHNPVLLFSVASASTIVPASIILLWVLLESLNGVWHGELAIFAIMLVLTSLVALAVSTISVLLNRMEKRILRKISS